MRTDIAFVTHCSDDWFYSGGCSKLLASAKHFHPDIPFYVFNNIELNELNRRYSGNLHWCNLNPVVSYEVAKKHRSVVHFDSDSIVLGHLTELIEALTSNKTNTVVTVRNNNDFNTASKYSDPPITINNCSPSSYMNAGLIGSNSILFWEYWITKNFQLESSLPYKEQDVLNLILQENKFNNICLDPIESNVHYGISCHYGKDGYWESSKLINKDGILGFRLKDKIIKVWHQAGGSQYFPKLNLEQFFNPECANEINKIISEQHTYEKIIL